MHLADRRALDCVDHMAIQAGDRRMFRHQARPQPEDDHVTGFGFVRMASVQMTRGGQQQGLMPGGFGPVRRIRGRPLGFLAVNFPINATHKTEAISSDLLDAGLMMIGRSQPASRHPDHLRTRYGVRCFPHCRLEPS